MEECVVCYENISEPLACKHFVHLACVIQSFRPECPVCRTPIPVSCVGTRPSAEPPTSEYLNSLYEQWEFPNSVEEENALYESLRENVERIIQAGPEDLIFIQGQEESGEIKADFEPSSEMEETEEETEEENEVPRYKNTQGYLYAEEDPDYDEENPNGDEVDY